MFLTDRQVAQRYNVNRMTPWKWVHSNPKFPKPIPITKGTKRWKLEELEAFEAGLSRDDADAIEADAAHDAAESDSQDHPAL